MGYPGFHFILLHYRHNAKRRGELEAGSTRYISWTYTGNPGSTVQIFLIRPTYADLWVTQSTPIGTNGQGSFAWLIPSYESQGFGYKIMIKSESDQSIVDESEDYFSIFPATPIISTKIGIFRPTSGIWSLDSNGNFIWEVSDKSLSWGLPG